MPQRFNAAPWPALPLIVFALLVGACSEPEVSGPEAARQERPRRGGRLVAALRGEPQTLNPVTAVDRPSVMVTNRLMADLLHINRQTQEVEAALADSWTVSDDGLVYRLELRRDVRFSDGHPFDADDVLFSFRVYLDEELAYGGRQMLLVGDRPIEVRKINSHIVEFTLAEPAAVGLRVFDGVAILPRHLLQEPYEQGRLADLWGPSTPPDKIAGLGPFRLHEFRSGERLVLERNPHYWKSDPAGVRLPYLDELVLQFVTGEDTQVIRFKAGETDVIERIGASNFNQLARAGDEADYVMQDLGAGLSWVFMVLNQNPGGQSPAAQRRRQDWFGRQAFRRALSAAIDRQAVVRLAYGGRATPLWSHVSPGYKFWFNDRVPQPPRSLERAERLLAEAGFSRGDNGGQLRDPSGVPVEMSIISSSGNSQRMQTATLIQEDLRQLGIEATVVPLEHRAVIQRLLGNKEYDACILELGGGDPDPNPQLNTLLSDGPLHLWRLGEPRPATPWEAEIDRLMRDQISTLERDERKRMFDRVQMIMAERSPVIPIVSPHVLVGAKRSLGNFRPAVMPPNTLWNAEELYWREATQ